LAPYARPSPIYPLRNIVLVIVQEPPVGGKTGLFVGEQGGIAPPPLVPPRPLLPPSQAARGRDSISCR
jgi:hypothetical protein